MKSSSQRRSGSTLVRVLRERAEREPARVALTFVTGAPGGDPGVVMSYGELDARARAWAAVLQARGAAGERALLLFSPGVDYVVGFLGCLYAGVVAVPAYPPSPSRANRHLARLQAVIDDARAGFVLTSREIAAASGGALAGPGGLRWVVADEIAPADGEAWRAPAASSGDPAATAFLQYSSGSTGDPKGVMVSHGNLAANLTAIERGFALGRDDAAVLWLPPYHDMGLIGGILSPLWSGYPVVLLPPVAFLQRPMRWLHAIAHHGGTIAGGPDFAFDLCARRATEADKAGLDLRRWQVAFTGAEPIRAATLERFAAAFAPCGFDRRAFYACYGLAEATLMVSGAQRGVAPVVRTLDREALEAGRVEDAAGGERAGLAVVGCGAPVAEHDVAIVAPGAHVRAAAGELGEIWVAGPSVAGGYWGQREASAQVFGARIAGEPVDRAYLRTGDLGFVDGDQLFVTGRLKDLLILRGRNHFAHDLEATVAACHPSLRAGACAAFSIEHDAAEVLVIVQELEARAGADVAPAVFAAIQRALAEGHELRAHALVLVKLGAIERTSSGKLRRPAIKARYLAGELVAVATRVDGDAGAGGRDAGAGDGGRDDDAGGVGRDAVDARAAGDATTVDGVAGGLRRIIAEVLQVAPRAVVAGVPITSLGLDSMRAVELQHRAETELGVVLPVGVLLGGGSFDALIAGAVPVARAGSEAADEAEAGAQPMSAGQRALWFLHELAPASTAQVVIRAMRLRQAVDAAALARAFDGVARRHPALRTTFPRVAGAPVRWVHDAAVVPFEQRDVPGASDAEIDAMVTREAGRPFALTREVGVRVVLLRRAPADHVLVVAMHHIITDAWSMAIVARELGALYAAERAGGVAALPPVGSTYTAHVRALDAATAGGAGDALRARWRQRLRDGAIAPLELVTDRPRTRAAVERGAVQPFALDAATTRAVGELARRTGATPYVVLLAVLEAVLARHAGQAEFVVASPAAGRRGAASAGVVGYFANVVLLPADVSGAPSLIELIARTREVVVAALADQELAYAEVARALAGGDVRGDARFRVMFTFQRGTGDAAALLAPLALEAVGAHVALGELVLEPWPIRERAAGAELSVVIAEHDGRLRGAIEYDAALYDAETIARLARHYELLVQAGVAAPEAPVARHALVSADDARWICARLTGPALDDAREHRVHALVAAQARRTPDAIAIVDGDAALSYAELEAGANRLARYLMELGVGRDDRVAICLPRGADLIVAPLAVLKTGAAYVPLDPAYPAARLGVILEIAAPRAIVTCRAVDAALPASPVPRVRIDDDAAAIAAARPDPVVRDVAPDQLAYVLFTSGSTGTPKGVAIEHRAAAARIAWGVQAYSAAELAGVLFSTSLCFDLSVFEIYVPLACGGAVIVAEDALALPALAARDRVTLLNTVPSALAELVRDRGVPDSVVTINVCGEPLTRAVVDASWARTRATRFVNLYGPTEDATYSTLAEQGRGGEGAPEIGVPLPGSWCRVLDAAGQLAPVGVPGELFLGGTCLARGYLARPDLTDERFVTLAAAQVGGRGGAQARMFRTGDRVRLRNDGALEFLGRLDHQVKLRGFRVELGEIEAVLGRVAGVREVAAVVRGDGPAATLVAYVVLADGAALAARDLEARVAAALPAYMVPSVFVVLPALPRTPNGKLDRKALPAPATDAAVFVAPRTAAEASVAAIFAEVLGAARVSVDDRFGDLGGHSLIATQVMARVRDRLGVALPLRALFEAPTAALLAARVEAARGPAMLSAREGAGGAWTGAVPEVIPRRASGARVPASPAQARLCFLDQLAHGGAAYHLPGAVELDGELDREALARSLGALVERHAALRTTFTVVDGVPVQIIRPPREPELALPVRDLRGLGADAEAEARRLARIEAAAPFDLAAGPLVRAKLIAVADARHVLLLTLHHIIADGWSLGVLIRELGELYAAAVARRPAALPAVVLDDADVVAWQHARAAEGAFADDVAYFARALAGAPPASELPADRPRGAGDPANGACVRRGLGGALTQAIDAFAQREQATPFMVLLAAFDILMMRHTGQTDLVVGTAVANRTRAELEPVVGLRSRRSRCASRWRVSRAWPRQ